MIRVRPFPGALLLFLVLALGAPAALHPAVLGNRHLFAEVDEETGRIFLATGGEPRQGLLFFDRPPSSFILLRAGDDLAVFGGGRGRFVTRPVTMQDRLLAQWESGGVLASQALSLVTRKSSGREDGLLITLTLRNQTGASVEVGARMILDTVLGEGGSAHFRLSDGRGIRGETVLQETDLPRAWVSTDTMGYRACLRGVLRGELVTTPSTVVFANYRKMSRDRNYEPDPGRPFHDPPFSRNDSAVALYFGPHKLPPGGEVSYRTILGLCGGESYGRPGKVELTPRQKRRVRRELKRIQEIRGSLEDINRLLEEINSLLEGGDPDISEEQLKKIIDGLKEAQRGS